VLDSYRTRKSRASWAALVVLLLARAAPGLAAPAQSRTYNLASGSIEGIYFPLAWDIAASARQAGLEIRVLPSEGSKQNLAWLAEGRADFALTQSDTAWDYHHGHGGFASSAVGLRAIAPLYTEAVHILIRRPLYVHRVEDLRGKRISVGPIGSGTEDNAVQVLAAAGLTLDEVAARHLGTGETIAALRQGELDAAFITSGVPSAAVAAVLKDGSASFLEPDYDLLERLLAAYPFFLSKNIEPSDYPSLDGPVTTVAVRALLVGRSDLPEAAVEQLVRALSANAALAAKYRLPVLDAGTPDIPIPTFEPARSRYTIHSLLGRRKLLLGLLLGGLAAVLLAARFKREIWRLLRRDEFLRVGIYFCVVWVVGSLALYWTEHRVNDYYSTPWKSMWSGFITIYSLSSKEPLTFEGRDRRLHLPPRPRGSRMADGKARFLLPRKEDPADDTRRLHQDA
jgi:TRAP transporter TAXI family solute receptor